MVRRFILLLLLVSGGWAINAQGQPKSVAKKITPEMSQKIVRQILDKNIRIFKKYKGVESLRVTTSEFYDLETGELEESESVKYVQKSYFYEVPETTVLEYRKNGKIVDPSEYDSDDNLPGYQIFDEKGPERFEITITGTQSRNGRDCYVLKILPKQQTSRHFKGTVFVDVDSLETVYLEGTIADYPFGLKKMNMTFTFESLGEIFVFTHATVDLLVHVPIIKPNTRILITTRTMENKPIPR